MPQPTTPERIHFRDGNSVDVKIGQVFMARSKELDGGMEWPFEIVAVLTHKKKTLFAAIKNSVKPPCGDQLTLFDTDGLEISDVAIMKFYLVRLSRRKSIFEKKEK